jgi:hypothetical protein
MLSAASQLRKICRPIGRQIFRQDPNPSLPFPRPPRGQLSGAPRGTYRLPPNPAIEDLIRQVLYRLSLTYEGHDLAQGVIARFRALVGDLPASANHHHSEPFGLVRHSLEVALNMLKEFAGTIVTEHHPDGSVDGFETARNRPRWQYLSFLAGLCHDLGKLMDMEVRADDRLWSPLHETYAEFLRQAKTKPVLRWHKDRVRGGHAMFAASLLHHLLTPADIKFLGKKRFLQLTDALTGSHNGDHSAPLAAILRQLDQKSVEEAAPDWMAKQPDSKVNQFIRALRTMIENGTLGVNYAGAQVYVRGGKAAVVVPLAIQLARDLLKREKITLPGNIHLYDLLGQSRLVEADQAGQSVRKIRVPGKHGPVELSALIFRTETIVPNEIVSTLPAIGFEIKPEPQKHMEPIASSGEVTPTAVRDPLC